MLAKYTFFRNLFSKKNKANLINRSFISSSLLNNSSKIATIKTIKYGDGIPDETIFAKNKKTMKNIKKILKNETCAIIGYGSQGRAQALNLRSSGINVCIGVRENGNSWKNALKDKFIPESTLLSIPIAIAKSSIIMFLISDAGLIDLYPKIRYKLHNKTLYFSHGFGPVYKNHTHITFDGLENIDVIMVAPKGSGKSVRELYKKGKGINSSYAILKDSSKMAKDKALAIGFGIGSPYIYETTFENEANSDLTGERSILMGGIAGLFKAQYDILRKNGHCPSEAFNETVEEALQSLYPLINEKGMEYMFSNCSSTAQRGAIDWSKKFEELNRPLIEELYEKVKSGEEAKRIIECNSDTDYREKLDCELEKINNEEIWKVGREIRKLRV